MTPALKVGIIGSGIGGLTTAIALRRRGITATVYEQATKLGEVGAGITLTPNVCKVLRAIDLESDVAHLGFEPERHVLRSWRSGRVLFAAPLRDAYRQSFDGTLYQIHRPDLHRLLVSQLRPDAIVRGAQCTAVRTKAKLAIAEFSDGSRFEGDLLVGADGIHSTVRKSLFGADDPKFTGLICWRGTVPAAQANNYPILPDVTNWLGPHGHVVHYFTRAERDLINFVAVHESAEWGEESWSKQGDPSELLAQFAGWHPALLELLSHQQFLLKWALFDRDPLPQWSNGPVTLVGDAAHAMLPFLGQGAAMAIEDAYALAELVAAGSESIEATLRKYEELRRPRTARVQIGSRERAGKNHLSSPIARFRRDIGYYIRRLFRYGRTPHRIDWVYGYDLPAIVGALSAKPRPAAATTKSASSSEAA